MLKTTAQINVQHLECMAFQSVFKGRYVYYSEAWALNLLSRLSAHMPVPDTFFPKVNVILMCLGVNLVLM